VIISTQTKENSSNMTALRHSSSIRISCSEGLGSLASEIVKSIYSLAQILI